MGMLTKLDEIKISTPESGEAKIGAIVVDVEGLFDGVKLNLAEAKAKLSIILDDVMIPNQDPSVGVLIEMIDALA